jgi:hypothetical protein
MFTRIIATILLVAFGLFCISACISNWWAAWAPPGAENVNFKTLRFNGYLYLAGFVLSAIAVIILWVWTCKVQADKKAM